MDQGRSVSLARSAISNLSITNTENSSVPASTSSESTLDNQEIIDKLEIDSTLIPKADSDTSKATVFDAFNRFNAIKLAHNRLTDKSIKWTKKPSERAIIQLFISTSQFYGAWSKAFKPVFAQYPQMKLWLQKDPEALDAETVWGTKQDIYTIKDLMEWCKEQKDQEEKLEKKGKKDEKATAKKSKKKDGSALQK